MIYCNSDYSTSNASFCDFLKAKGGFSSCCSCGSYGWGDDCPSCGGYSGGCSNGCGCGSGCSCGCGNDNCGCGNGCSCGCGSGDSARSVLILGSGCKNCQTLEANARAALEQMGDTHFTVGHVTDFAEIAKYGVMSTPGLVVDGKVVSCGRVLKPEEIVALLEKSQG